MQVSEKTREPANINAVALKAYARVVDLWRLSVKEAAGLADMSESTWKRARKPDFAGELTKDQLLRLSAVIGIYKSLELYFSEPLARSWFSRPNAGPCSVADDPWTPRSRVGCRRSWRFVPISMPCAVAHEAERDSRPRSDPPFPATYHKLPALRGLVDTDDELTVLAEVEGLTSGRLLAERGRNPHLDPRELAWRRRSRDLAVYGDTHANAAFVYTRAGGNRFNSDERGAWYCAWDVLVSVSEVAWHRTRELGYAGSFNDSARYVELLADFIGEFNDITDEPRHPALNPDPEIGYPEGQSLARNLRREGSRGLIYPSVRAPHPGGNCLVCFEPHAIQNVRPGASWDLVWDGTPDYSILAVG